MCMNPSKDGKRSYYNWFLIGGVVLGVLTGFLNVAFLNTITSAVGEIFIRLLKFIALPMIFFSVVATIANMDNLREVRTIGRRIFIYAVVLTFVAGFIGFIVFSIVQPVGEIVGTIEGGAAAHSMSSTYWDTLITLFPSNAIEPFLEGHVLGIMFMAIVFGLAILSLPDEQRSPLKLGFASLFAAILKFTHWMVYLMPLAIWAFVSDVTLTFRTEDPSRLFSFALYIGCVVAANLLQGVVILPLVLKLRGVRPLRLFRQMGPALSVAFLTRSSNIALPVTLECAQTNAKLSRKVSNFAVPLCATINMNACAAFMVITVFFVGGSYGIHFSLIDQLIWVGIATLAAVGNAGVPMGCFFLSSAMLAGMGVPLTMMGMILPVYTLLDMLETALNVWSDCCVTAIVDKEVKKLGLISEDIDDQPLAANE